MSVVSTYTGDATTEEQREAYFANVGELCDLAKARAYYDGVLGLADAFDLKDSTGRITSAFFKINDDQYIEVTPILETFATAHPRNLKFVLKHWPINTACNAGASRTLHP